MFYNTLIKIYSNLDPNSYIKSFYADVQPYLKSMMFEDGFEIVLGTIKHITNTIIDMAIVQDLVFKVEARIRSPCFFKKSVDLTKICKKR